MKSIIILVSLLLFSFMFLSCFGSSKKNIREVSRTTSPDSVVDVVMAVDKGVAVFTRQVTLIYIVPKGLEIEDYEAFVFSANDIDSLSLQWKKPEILEIHYKNAQIYNFSNVWYSKFVDSYNYVVELKLVKDGNEKIKLR